MLWITNISISPAATLVLDQERATFKRHGSDVFALIYMFSFINADGTAVADFHPGYTAGAWGAEYLGAKWALARLPHGLEFYFLPRFEWKVHERYVVDIVSHRYALFSIGPTTYGPASPSTQPTPPPS